MESVNVEENEKTEHRDTAFHARDGRFSLLNHTAVLLSRPAAPIHRGGMGKSAARLCISHKK